MCLKIVLTHEPDTLTHVRLISAPRPTCLTPRPHAVSPTSKLVLTRFHLFSQRPTRLTRTVWTRLTPLRPSVPTSLPESPLPTLVNPRPTLLTTPDASHTRLTHLTPARMASPDTSDRLTHARRISHTSTHLTHTRFVSPILHFVSHTPYASHPCLTMFNIPRA